MSLPRSPEREYKASCSRVEIDWYLEYDAQPATYPGSCFLAVAHQDRLLAFPFAI